MNNVSPLAFIEDDHKLEIRIRKLKESSLITNLLFKIILSTTIIGVLALLVP
jgi:hypothetical protein